MGTLRPRLDTLDSEIVLGSGVWDWIELWTQLPWIKWEVFLKIAKEKGVFSRGGKKQICQEETFVWLLAVRDGNKLAYKVMHISLLY